MHYDPYLPLTLVSATSPVGIGCALSHIYPEGSERPIAFASRTLSGLEQKYSPIDKEALAVIWAAKSFIYTLKELRQESGKDKEVVPLFKALREVKNLRGRRGEPSTLLRMWLYYIRTKGLHSKEISEECSGRITCWTLRNSKNKGHG
ncbi:uncharacterized protein K02A2.6 [Trichonephila inaurata madagascariensis]|uniref:Uncharacterized protein K02A2.6 n=1 Tax=Trichonephila inaurata madagascariensis TaxID=2747483 RepID=A0A8X6XPS7_9ARAC|nr:uncharacterized protein K02A2.6 [Trichonephila inaurata madagascariensis]